MSSITTHVLDTSKGKPASGIPVRLSCFTNQAWKEIGNGVTDKDGRVTDLMGKSEKPEKGIYKLSFETGQYFKEKNELTIYPYAEIVFEISNGEHYHIPLLLNPFGYTTYRGS